MKKAISNIAWSFDEDLEAFEVLRDKGFQGIEVAPTRINQDIFNNIKVYSEKFIEQISRFDLKAVSMQSLHFGQADCQLFYDEESRKKLMDHTRKCIDLAHELSIPNLVFGSPKNRNIPEGLEEKKAKEIALSFFRELGDILKGSECSINIEANPLVYGTNFLNETQAAFEFVEEVGHSNINLNFDLGTTTINQNDPIQLIEKTFSRIRHIHISQPMLEDISTPEIEETQREVLEKLRSLNYLHWISIEMKPNLRENNLETVEFALDRINNLAN